MSRMYSYTGCIPKLVDFVSLIVEVECLYDWGSIYYGKCYDVDKVLEEVPELSRRIKEYARDEAACY